MDSDKGPVVFPLLTLGEVFHVKILSIIFVIISLADYFLGCISLTPNRLNQQGKNILYCVYFPTTSTWFPAGNPQAIKHSILKHIQQSVQWQSELGIPSIKRAGGAGCL